MSQCIVSPIRDATVPLRQCQNMSCALHWSRKINEIVKTYGIFAKCTFIPQLSFGPFCLYLWCQHFTGQHKYDWFSQIKLSGSYPWSMKMIVFLILSTHWGRVIHMHQQTRPLLVQVMICRLFSTSHYLNQRWLIFYWTLGSKFQSHLCTNAKNFIQEN